jgi:hypothetical protein
VALGDIGKVRGGVEGETLTGFREGKGSIEAAGLEIQDGEGRRAEAGVEDEGAFGARDPFGVGGISIERQRNTSGSEAPTGGQCNCQQGESSKGGHH